MSNIGHIIFSEVNITLTILMLLLIVYWVLTMVSGIDFDYDVDVDIDLDVDVDADTGIEGGNMDFQDIANAEVDKEQVVGNRRQPLKWWQIVLIYFNFVGLPFMFTFTAWIFIWWFVTVLITKLTGSYENAFGFVVMLGAMIPSLFVTKIFTTPFKGFFKNLNKDGDKAVEYLGRTGTMLSSISGERMGNAEVFINGDSYNIYVKSLDGSPLQYQQKILIINQANDKNSFLVQAYNN